MFIEATARFLEVVNKDVRQVIHFDTQQSLLNPSCWAIKEVLLAFESSVTKRGCGESGTTKSTR